MISELQDAYTKAVERAWASTVNVGVAGAPYPQQGRWGPWPRRGFGSGVVMDHEGHILTNQHVVQDAEKILVTFPDGRVLPGTVVGGDEDTDVAVIKVEGDGVKPAEFGDSDRLKVGQPVLAIGNPLGLSGGPTVTSGVVSSLRRSLDLGSGGLKVIQTDAAVNPGNSGGPLVDLEGKVVAINTVTIPYAEGIGFAIPANAALKVAKELLQSGRVARPWLGVAGYDVDRRLAGYYGLTVSRGVFLGEVNENGPAAAAGLEVGDVIVSVADRPVAGVGDLVDSIREKKIADAVDIEVVRRGKKVSVRATLGSRPW
ncbi:MAG: PDZ domain-containing protein [Methanobacteriota archaeon]|nr:MAG: PDZ domain-containing protein [Euryarchaeota archaeon]